MQIFPDSSFSPVLEKMGKNRHSKDKMYITATEWSQEYGGKKTTREAASRPLPFDHCALSLTPFRTPVLLGKNSGVIFDFEVIVPYLQEHKCDPVSGDAMTTKDIIRLHMTKNAAGEWEWYVPAYNRMILKLLYLKSIRVTTFDFSQPNHQQSIHEFFSCGGHRLVGQRVLIRSRE